MESRGYRRCRIVLGWVLVVAFSIPLLAHAYIGSFSRMFADDYSFTANLQERGFCGFQKDCFETQNGRFSAALAMTLAYRFHGKLIPWLPLLTIAAWLMTLSWGMVQLQHVAGQPAPVFAALLLSEVILVATLVLMPMAFQSLYWASAMLNYVPPLVLLPLYAGLVCKGIRATTPGWRATWFAVSCVTAFFAAGFSETAFILQLTLLALSVVIVAMGFTRLPKQAPIIFLAGGLVASALSAAVRLAAPGNNARLAAEALGSAGEPLRNPFALFTCSLQFGFESFCRSIFTSRSMALTAILLPAIVAFHLADRDGGRSAKAPDLKKLLKWIAVTPWLAFVLVLSCYLPASYVATYVHAGFQPPPRVGVAPQFAFFACACAWGYLLGMAVRRATINRELRMTTVVRWGTIVMVALISLVPLNAARHTLQIAPTMRRFAREWDAMDEMLRAARERGQTHVEVPLLPHTGRYQGSVFLYSVHVIDFNPTNWVNQCAAHYYGLDSIVARE
jgi:hypothetical protein